MKHLYAYYIAYILYLWWYDKRTEQGRSQLKSSYGYRKVKMQTHNFWSQNEVTKNNDSVCQFLFYNNIRNIHTYIVY